MSEHEAGWHRQDDGTFRFHDGTAWTNQYGSGFPPGSFPPPDHAGFGMGDFGPGPGPEVSWSGFSPPPQDPITMLRRLAELRDDGIITEDEFLAKKADILARI